MLPAIARDVTDAQWKILDELIPEPTTRSDGRGRPWKDRRSVLNGILWVLRTGAPWADVPDRYPSYQIIEAMRNRDTTTCDTPMRHLVLGSEARAVGHVA